MGKFYIVGFSSPSQGKNRIPSILGDALVYAEDKSDALTRMRRAGWIPNPGDIHTYGGKGYREGHASDFETVGGLLSTELEDEAKQDENGIAYIWSSWP